MSNPSRLQPRKNVVKKVSKTVRVSPTAPKKSPVGKKVSRGGKELPVTAVVAKAKKKNQSAGLLLVGIKRTKPKTKPKTEKERVVRVKASPTKTKNNMLRKKVKSVDDLKESPKKKLPTSKKLPAPEKPLAPKKLPPPSLSKFSSVSANTRTALFSPDAVGAERPLTEAQLRRMPASEYMSLRQLDFFKRLLLKLREELMGKVDVVSARMKDNFAVPDPADQATIEEEHALELRIQDRERKLVRKIEEALTRIASGDYGHCEETGDPIGLNRLLARPTATLSIEAQERREKKRMQYGES